MMCFELVCYTAGDSFMLPGSFAILLGFDTCFSDKMVKSPYLKCESQNYFYRPFFTELDNWPRLNGDTPRGSCPFDGTMIKW